MSCARETCSSIDTNWDELTAGRINLLYLSGLSRWFISFSSASAAVLPVRHQIWGYRRDTRSQAVGITEFLCIRSFSWNNEGFWFSEDCCRLAWTEGMVLAPTSCWSGLSVIEHRLKQENQGAVGFFPQYKVKLRLTSILGTHLQSGGKPMLLSAEKECFKDPSEGSLGVTSLFVVIGGRKMIVVTLRIWESDQWAAEAIAIASSLVACNVSFSEWFSMKITSANLSLTSCREKKPDLICTSTDISILDGQGWSLVTAQYRISKLLSNEPEHSAWSRMTYGTTPEVNASVPCS